MLSVNNCTFSYNRGSRPTIDSFTMSFEEGGVYGLLGSNGVGKTTLLQLISGLLTPDSGNVTLDGIVTRRRLPEILSEIYLVAEETEFPPISLNSFIKANSRLYPRYSDEDMDRHLRTFGLERNLQLNKLSMGQKKKVALAFAMACNTKVLMMDEPTNGLDIPAKSAFRRFVAESMSDDRIFIISTHQVRDVGQILDHVLIVNNHRVLLNRTVGEIASHLLFKETSDKELIASAYYAQPGLGGSSVIVPNDSDDETEIDLELLFDFTIQNPDLLNSIFSNNNIESQS